MSNYRIKTTEWKIWVLTLLAASLACVFLTSKLLPKTETTTIILFIVMAFLSFFLQRFTSVAMVEITLTKENISVTWLSQYIFHKKPNRIIPISDIASYKYQPDKNFSLLQFTMKDGSVVKLWHSAFTSSEDFDRLVRDFAQLVSSYNSKTKDRLRSDTNERQPEATTIKRMPTIYEGTGAILLTAFAVILIIVFISSLFSSSNGRRESPFYLLASVSGAIFFLSQYFKYRKHTKSKPGSS